MLAAHFDGPVALAVVGPDLFVANEGNPSSFFPGGAGPGPVGSVDELDIATGSLVKVLSGHTYGFDNPIALAVVGQTIWIANGAGNSITVVSSSTGAFLRYLP